MAEQPKDLLEDTPEQIEQSKDESSQTQTVTITTFRATVVGTPAPQEEDNGSGRSDSV